MSNAEKAWDDTVQKKIDQTLDYVELVLAAGGLLPGLGTPASAASALIALWRGHYLSAALSAVGVVPFVGTLASLRTAPPGIAH